MEQITRLAEEMGVTEGDVISFVLMVGHYMDKGMTMDAAINVVAANATALLSFACRTAKNKDFRTALAGEVWDAIQQGAAK